MDEIIKHVASKISSYNIFNNLLPGIIFCYGLKYIDGVTIVTSNWFENLFVFYFVGMILSRIGSVIIEPILRRIKIKNKAVKYATYFDYKDASKIDTFIKIMLETNNMYRTLIATFICLFLSKCYFEGLSRISESTALIFNNIGEWILLLFFIVIFICSFMKQTGYIYKSVELYKQKKIESEYGITDSDSEIQ